MYKLVLGRDQKRHAQSSQMVCSEQTGGLVGVNRWFSPGKPITFCPLSTRKIRCFQPFFQPPKHPSSCKMLSIKQLQKIQNSVICPQRCVCSQIRYSHAFICTKISNCFYKFLKRHSCLIATIQPVEKVRWLFLVFDINM